MCIIFQTIPEKTHGYLFIYFCRSLQVRCQGSNNFETRTMQPRMHYHYPYYKLKKGANNSRVDYKQQSVKLLLQIYYIKSITQTGSTILQEQWTNCTVSFPLCCMSQHWRMFAPSASISPHLQSIDISQDVGMPQCLHSLECCFGQLRLLLCTLSHFVQKHRHWLPSRLQRKYTGSPNSTRYISSERVKHANTQIWPDTDVLMVLCSCPICVFCQSKHVGGIKYANCEIHQIQSANNSVSDWCLYSSIE